MVRIPTPAERGQQVGTVEQSNVVTPFFNVQPADTSGSGRLLSQAGGAMVQMAQVLQQRNEDAALRQAEIEAQQFERDLLNPQTGLLSQQGGSAMGATNRTMDQWSQRRDEILQKYGDNVGRSGRQALERYLDGAGQRFYKSAAGHELQQNRVYTEGQIAAQIEGAGDIAALNYNDPDAVAGQMLKTEMLTRQLAASQGKSPEETEMMVQQAQSDAALRVISSIARTDPTTALARLESYVQEGMVDPNVAQGIIDKVEPLAIDQQGKALAHFAAAAGGGTRGTASSNPSDFIMRLGRSESGAAGINAVNDAVGSSGRRGHFGELQFGRDRLDEARSSGVIPADVTGEDLIGQTGRLTDAQRQDLQNKLAIWHVKDIDNFIDRNGFDKLGLSRDGMRAVAHLGGKGGLRKFINSGGRANPADAFGTSLLDYYNRFAGGVPGAQDIIAREEDPRVRQVAQAELTARENQQYTQRNRLAKQLTDEIYADFTKSEVSGQPFDLDAILRQNPEFIDILGDNISGVRKFIESRKGGAEPKTSREVLQELALLKRDNPQQFVGTNILADYGDRLDDTDFQAQLRAQERTADLLAKPDGAYSITKLNRMVKNPIELLKAREGKRVGKVQIDDAFEASIESQVRDQIDLVTSQNNGAPPSEMQVQNMIQTALNSELARIDPPGVLNQSSDINLQAARQQVEGKSIDWLKRSDIVLQYEQPDGSVILHRVSPQEIDSFVEAYRQWRGRTPDNATILTFLQLNPPTPEEMNVVE